ncbi:hypothetical protein QA640_32160 [Bradyrhizobium sp. CB82]|uniref:hypothetical protein n=1 Tax=Bradyrhizobium sp. CB82 TaxID=3039159 RepID=UPI0024B1BDE4|nr:hypothetical protein [Bradyrhizobium sp. CB82]WFU39016.1 hypothetical protein QA640_32160 [Bradyrhizobium sp. CB82]
MGRKVLVVFDEHDFEQLEMLAKLRKISIAEQVRRMCRAPSSTALPGRIRRQACDARSRSRRRLLIASRLDLRGVVTANPCG